MTKYPRRASTHIIRLVPVEEVATSDYYKDMADLAVIFNHEVVETASGRTKSGKTWRWKPNDLIDLLHEHGAFYTPSSHEDHETVRMPYTQHSRKHRGSIDLNELRMDLIRGQFSVEEYMKFNMQIGYSLSGYAEVFGQSEAHEWGLADALRERPGRHEDDYIETPIEYVRRIHKGKVLKL